MLALSSVRITRRLPSLSMTPFSGTISVMRRPEVTTWSSAERGCTWRVFIPQARDIC